MKKSKNLVTMLLIMLMVAMMLPASASAASKVKLNKTKLSLNVKKTYQLKVTGTTKKAKWSTSNKTVATVNSKGKITAKKKGTATITAKVSGKKYTCKVTVKQPVTSVKLSKKTVTLKKKGRTVTLKAIVGPTSANNKKVAWKSSNTRVATVSASGKVTAVASGTAKITATAKDGSKKKATCTVIVKIASSTSGSNTPKHEHTWVPQYTTVTVPAETRTNTTYMPVCEHGAYLYTEYDCACGAVFKSAQEWSRHVDEMTDLGDTRNHSSSADGVYAALNTTQPKTRTVYICSCGTKFMCGKFGCDSRTEEAAIEAINHHITVTHHTSQGKVTYQEAVVYEGETTRYDVHQEIVVVKPATTKQVLTGYKCSCGATK